MGEQSTDGTERFEYQAVYTPTDTYQNILDGMAAEGWRFVESIDQDDIFVFERPVRSVDTDTDQPDA